MVIRRPVLCFEARVTWDSELSTLIDLRMSDAAGDMSAAQPAPMRSMDGG